ncbi:MULTISPECIES: magnesium protoporphyrin IX methyltransferase [Thalassobaculum]|uniref:Magnesium protoporphyrin IX methyltransferase n=1 Tax=Thalassobaculum litoreum DSM 18839 TaxID=1123362 RepID=A0A8G2EX63_9PROT|nr:MULTISPECIES: magnesium protoporphyrin IX methyltransferase [Thalassobaculum]SDF26475.1 Mg-protoporphyrin IX methyltransferase [Thalassobaculum litoreum DSM 18839]
MLSATYTDRRQQVEAYFDRTAADAWARLTSDAPVSGIRATVRAGRDRMRRLLLGWLPEDLAGRRVLDAGCGTGSLAVEAARRGALVTAIDISPTLIQLARERTPEDLGAGRVEFLVGDMLDPALGSFDHVVAMDSLIHYRTEDAVQALGRLAPRTAGSIVFTFAPRTALLTVMHTAGRLFPRGDRAPSIQPTAHARLRAALDREGWVSGMRPCRSERIDSGFYISQAMELARS